MDAFIGEIRAFGFDWAPYGWLECDGQVYAVRQFQALFVLLGKRFGGDGQTTFGVPNLQGRTPMGLGVTSAANVIGATAGSETVPLGLSNFPSHTHTAYLGVPTDITKMVGTPDNTSYMSRMFASASTTALAIGDVTAQSAGVAPTNPVALNTLDTTGVNSVTHENRQPYLTLNYCINWDGIFPDLQ